MYLKYFAAGVLLVLASGFQVQAQFFKKFFSEIEVIGGLGTTNYFGDIGGKDPEITGARVFFDNLDIDVYQTRMMAVAGLRLANNKNYSFSLQFAPVFISGSDERSKYVYEGRHYAFSTRMLEVSFQGEYYFSDRMTRFAPYVFGGLGAIGYSVEYTENSLNPEPQKTSWKTANTFILGLGGRLPTRSKFVHTFDIGYHFSTTDFLDAFITDRKTKDLFFAITYKINFQLYNSWYMDHRGLVR